MFVRFVSTDYSSLILYVRFEDGGEVTSLWTLLGRWWLTLTLDTPHVCPRHMFSACCSEGVSASLTCSELHHHAPPPSTRRSHTYPPTGAHLIPASSLPCAGRVLGAWIFRG